MFGLCSEHLSVALRSIGFIRFQTQRNDDSRGKYRYHLILFHSLSSAIDYLSTETFEFHVESTVWDTGKRICLQWSAILLQ